MTEQLRSSFWKRPTTRLGWWAAGLTAVFLVIFIFNSAVFILASPDFADGWWRENVLPFCAIIMLLCGLGGGIVGLMALIRKHERSWLVWLAILAGVFVLILVLGELLTS